MLDAATRSCNKWKTLLCANIWPDGHATFSASVRALPWIRRNRSFVHPILSVAKQKHDGRFRERAPERLGDAERPPREQPLSASGTRRWAPAAQT